MFELQAVPVADKLTEQLQQGGERTADTITANAQTLTQQIIQPEARQLAEQVCHFCGCAWSHHVAAFICAPVALAVPEHVLVQ